MVNSFFAIIKYYGIMGSFDNRLLKAPLETALTNTAKSTSGCQTS